MNNELELRFKLIYGFKITGVELRKNNLSFFTGYLETDDLDENVYRLGFTPDQFNEMLYDYD